MNYTLLSWLYWKTIRPTQIKNETTRFSPFEWLFIDSICCKKEEIKLKKKRNRIENIKIKTTDQCHMKEFLLFYMPANECDIHRMQIYTTWWVSVSLYNMCIDVGGQVCLKNKFSLIIRPKRNCLWYFCSWNINRNQDCVSFSLFFFFKSRICFLFALNYSTLKEEKNSFFKTVYWRFYK